MAEGNESAEIQKIEIEYNGPYIVHGGIPLVRKSQVVSEHGEPLTWRKDGTIPTDGEYRLCRCGHSKELPFCDSTHFEIDFDGTETADTGPAAARQEDLPGERIVIKRDSSLCMNSGFCGNHLTQVEAMLAQSGESTVRAQIIAMIERCPSGSYSYSIEPGGAEIEPDLPKQIAVMTEITSDGPIPGALWVTGGIPVERSDGEPFETRNRVTLCSCGLSANKPLCDGTHREHEVKKLRAQKPS